MLENTCNSCKSDFKWMGHYVDWSLTASLTWIAFNWYDLKVVNNSPCDKRAGMFSFLWHIFVICTVLKNLFSSVLTALLHPGGGEDSLWSCSVWGMGLLWWVQQDWCISALSHLLSNSDNPQCSHFTSGSLPCKSCLASASNYFELFCVILFCEKMNCAYECKGKAYMRCVCIWM